MAVGLTRFGVAMEGQLLERFDSLIARRGYGNRSEALRDLVRKELDREVWASGGQTVAAITLVYDHHVRELTERLTEIQHEYGAHVVSTLHVHLDADHCMEVIAAQGPARSIQAMAEALLRAKGVLSGDVTAAAVPKKSAGSTRRGAKRKGHGHSHH